MFGKRVPYVPKHMRGIEEDRDTDISHHGIKGMKWGVRRYQNPDGSLTQEGYAHYGKKAKASRTDISDETYAKINKLYRSMPLADRRMIDPDISDESQDYFKNSKYYHDNTAFNAVSDNGFVIAEKIPADKNIDGTHGVEIGIGVTEKGHGVGTGLTKDLVDWFDNQDEYDAMWWPVDENNKGSIRIAEKNGFIKDPLGSNYIYATGQAYRDLGIKDDLPDHIYNDLDTFDYGCIINGKRYNETNLDEVDWSQYRTTSTDIFEKTKIGTCWDYTNYQHSKLKEAGINHNTHMLVMDTDDGPVTHTFTTYEDPVNHKEYWLEQALYSERGIHPINSYTDAVDVISRKYDPSGKRAFDVYEFNPDGMDRGLNDQEFFNKATSNDPVLQRK